MLRLNQSPIRPDAGCSSEGEPALHSYNGYYATPVMSGTTSGNVTLSSSDFVTGPLGENYLQGSSTLINSGSRTATSAGLYHYTTQTSQTKESSSTVVR